jgi:hypothetical protein
MKKILLFLCLLLLAASCATQKNLTTDPSPKVMEVTPVYYDGNDKPAAFSGVVLYQTNN